MKLAWYTTFVLLLLVPFSVFAFDDLDHDTTIDIMYHYTRIERSTLLTTENFLSRQGAMLQWEYEEPINLFWRWYTGGDLTFARYEAAATTRFSPRDQFPWQVYIGSGLQLGALKSIEVFAGLGGSSEHFFISNASGFTFYQKMSARAHLGFSWRFLSIVGSTAKLLFRYSIPVTAVNHNGADLTYAGVVDATLRLRGRYDSGWSLYGGIRFEDYKTFNDSVSYFSSRLYAGLGLHF